MSAPAPARRVPRVATTVDEIAEMISSVLASAAIVDVEQHAAMGTRTLRGWIVRRDGERIVLFTPHGHVAIDVATIQRLRRVVHPGTRSP